MPVRCKSRCLRVVSRKDLWIHVQKLSLKSLRHRLVLDRMMVHSMIFFRLSFLHISGDVTVARLAAARA